MTIENWKYKDFVAANNGRFTALDFIHAVSSKIDLPYDFVMCIGGLISPDMVLFDGVVVASNWFDEEKYRERRRTGMAPGQAQAWSNLVEITDIFNGISFESAKELAGFLARTWDGVIEYKFPGEVVRSSIIVEEDSCEVFVTIGKFSDEGNV
jgi:hypothetical protein